MKRKLTLFAALLVLAAMSVTINGHKGFAADNGTEIPQKNISVAYNQESVIIDESSLDASKRDNVIYYIENYSSDISRWYACDVRDKKAMFDISWINSSTDVKLYICGDVNTKITSVTVAWKENLSVSFVGTLTAADVTDSEGWKEAYSEYPNFGEDTGYLTFTRRDNGRDSVYMALENIEWRKGDAGNWREYSELDLHEMQIKGGQLQFRIKSNNQNKNRSSSIAKYTVIKTQSAPTVSVTYNTGTVSLKNGMEFSTDKITWTLIPVYSSSGTTNATFVTQAERADAIKPITTKQKVTKLTVQEALGLETSASVPKTTIYVRTAATAKAAASKIKVVEIPATQQISASTVQSNITYTYLKSKDPVHSPAGIEITNNLDESYQIYVLSPAEQTKYDVDPSDSGSLTNLPASLFSWSTIRGKNSTRVVGSKAPTGSIILVRKAGTDSSLPSPYIALPAIVNNDDALTYAKVDTNDGLAVNSTLTATPSTNLIGKSGLTYEWQFANGKNVADSEWRTFATTKDVKIADGIYESVRGKYVRVKITYKGVTVTSEAVGTIK